MSTIPAIWPGERSSAHALEVSTRVERSLRLPVVVLILLAGAFHLLPLRPGHDWGDDFCLYIQHARNLATGRPYAETGYLYNPNAASLSPRSYPPGLPLLLAPVYAIFGLNLYAMKVSLLACFLLFLIVFHRLAVQLLPPTYAYAALAVIAFSPAFWSLKDRILSETPFLLFAYASLHAFSVAHSESVRTRQITWAAIAGIAIVLAVATRSVGIVLVPAVLLHALIHRRRALAVSGIVVSVFAAGWLLQRLFIPPDASYFDQLHLTPAILLRNIQNFIGSFGDFLDNGVSPTARRLLVATVATLGLIGYLSRIRNRPTVIEWFAAFYVAAIVVWPSSEGGLRFLLPALPLAILYTALGVLTLSARIGERWGTAIGSAVLTATLLSFAGQYRQQDFGPIRDGIGQPAVAALFAHLRDELPSNAVIVFPKPRAVALFTGHQGLAPHEANDDREVWRFWRAIGVTHVVLGQEFAESHSYLPAFVARHANAFTSTYTSDRFTVLTVHGTPEPPGESERTGR